MKKINPLIPLDYPDPDVIRVGEVYYMITTTMHFMPGGEILRSLDLLHWEHAAFVYDRIDSTPAQQLTETANIYGKGMWAATLRYHQGMFYVIFVANDTKKTYLYRSKQIAGPWKKSIIAGFYHDCSLLFDKERIFLVYGNREIWLTELDEKLTGPKKGGLHRLLVSDQDNPNLGYEGAHLYKIDGYYYAFFIHSLKERWFRTQACFVADSLTGTFSGGDVLVDDRNYCQQGVAQGGIVDTPDGKWYAILFQDHGAVGRLPILVPVQFENHFPVFGAAGKIPKSFPTPTAKHSTSLQPLIGSDSFDHIYATPYGFAPQWQFNHEPNAAGYTLDNKKQRYLIKPQKITENLTQSQNTLTQRMTFPTCQAQVTLNAEGLQEGDFAGLAVLQGAYGWIGVTKDQGKYYLVMKSRELTEFSLQGLPLDEHAGKEQARIRLFSPLVTLQVRANFSQMKDVTSFFYQTDGTFKQLGIEHPVAFKMDHFCGCRLGLFCYSTQQIGGFAAFSQFQYENTGEEQEVIDGKNN